MICKPPVAIVDNSSSDCCLTLIGGIKIKLNGVGLRGGDFSIGELVLNLGCSITVENESTIRYMQDAQSPIRSSLALSDMHSRGAENAVQ